MPRGAAEIAAAVAPGDLRHITNLTSLRLGPAHHRCPQFGGGVVADSPELRAGSGKPERSREEGRERKRERDRGREGEGEREREREKGKEGARERAREREW